MWSEISRSATSFGLIRLITWDAQLITIGDRFLDHYQWVASLWIRMLFVLRYIEIQLLLDWESWLYFHLFLILEIFQCNLGNFFNANRHLIWPLSYKLVVTSLGPWVPACWSARCLFRISLSKVFQLVLWQVLSSFFEDRLF